MFAIRVLIFTNVLLSLGSTAWAQAFPLTQGVLVGRSAVYISGTSTQARRITDGHVVFDSKAMQVLGALVGDQLFGWGPDGPVLLSAESGKLLASVTGHGRAPNDARFLVDDPSPGLVTVQWADLQGTGIPGRMHGTRHISVWKVGKGTLTLVESKIEQFVDQADDHREPMLDEEEPVAPQPGEPPDGWFECGSGFCQLGADENGLYHLRRRDGEVLRDVVISPRTGGEVFDSPERNLVAVPEKYFADKAERQWRIWSLDTLKPVAVVPRLRWLGAFVLRGRYLVYASNGPPDIFVVVASTGEPVWSMSRSW